MNRLLICILLLLISHSVAAEKLYRWVEPDGSITFSPKPPPDGVEFKAVNAAHNNAAKADLPVIDEKTSILATSEHGLEAPQHGTNATQMTTRPATAVAKQKLSYAPDTGSNVESPIKAAPAPEAQSTNQAPVSRTQTVDASKKRRQCQDLSKRVMSLERRLRSPLEPAEMDNTVIAMARYQRSYDQHCVE